MTVPEFMWIMPHKRPSAARTALFQLSEIAPLALAVPAKAAKQLEQHGLAACAKGAGNPGAGRRMMRITQKGQSLCMSEARE